MSTDTSTFTTTEAPLTRDETGRGWSPPTSPSARS